MLRLLLNIGYAISKIIDLLEMKIMSLFRIRKNVPFHTQKDLGQQFEQIKNKKNFYHRRRFNRNARIYAALDLGTSSCRLTLATPVGIGGIRVIDNFSSVVKLGEGLDQYQELSVEAMNRAVDALRICKEKMSQYSIEDSRLVATAACRRAINAPYFLERVYRETSLQLEVLDELTETRLAVASCQSLVSPSTESLLLFDIGGGSSEIAIIDRVGSTSPFLEDHIKAWISLPVGAVTLAEHFLYEQPSVDLFENQVSYVTKLLENFSNSYQLTELSQRKGFHLLGTAGTVTTLASTFLNLDRYNRSKIDGMWLKDFEITTMISKILTWDWEKRASNPSIGKARADLLIPGCAILEAIRRICPSPWVRVADRGIREGILNDLIFKSQLKVQKKQLVVLD